VNKIKERHFILNIFLLCLAIFLIIGFVSGYGTNAPDTFGHSLGEVGLSATDNLYVWKRALQTGDYYDCKSTCDGSYFISDTDIKCEYYTNGAKADNYYCPSGEEVCSTSCGSPLTFPCCATKNVVSSTQLGKVVYQTI